MPFSVTCPGCESVYPVGEALIGKTIRCKKCGELIEVSAPAAARAPAKAAAAVRPKPARVTDDEDDAPPAKPVKRPARAAVDDDEDDDYEDSPKKGPPVLLLAGVLAAVLLVGGGVGAYVMLGGDGDKTDTVQNNTPVATPPAPQPNLSPRGVQPDPEPPSSAPTAKAPSAGTKTQPAAAKEPPANNTATQKTTAPPPPVANDRVPSSPTSQGLSQREYMIGKMDRITLEKVKRAAVMFKVQTEIGTAEGSGWFGIEPGLVFTNAHVIGMKSQGSKEPKKITMYLNPGTPEQREIPHHRIKILAYDRDIDLALLQVIGEKDLPVPLKVKPSLELVEGQGMNTVGFPLGTIVSMAASRTKKEPEVSIRPTTFTAFRRDQFGQPRRIQVEGGIYGGNSGGAIVDAEGTVCGVAVEVMLDRNTGAQNQLGLGVPTEYVFGLLAGRIGEIEYEMPYRDNGKVRIPVKVKCLDPLKRLNEVGIAGWVADTSDKFRQPGSTKPQLQPGDADYQKIKLKYDEATKTAKGELVMPELPPGRAYWVQPYYANSSTPEYWLPGTKIPVIGPPVDRTPADLTVKFKVGARRSVTMSNSSDISEYVEGEGESKNERVTYKTTLKVTETVFAADRPEYAARLRLNFEEIGIKAEIGSAIEEDFVPKRILKLINDFAKLAEAIGFVRRDGQIFRYQVNLLTIQDPLGKALISAFGSEAMEALQAASIPLPNRRVNAGEKWEAMANVRLSMAFVKIGKSGKPEQQVKEYKYVNKITYTYVGQRERAGKKEAVIMVEGKVSAAPGSKETATGMMKGFALVELDNGSVVEAELENEIELDTSGDGLKKKVSGINKYKLSRGSSAQ